MARIIVALAATALLVARGGAAAAESCVIAGGPQAPVEVRIYESDPYGAPAGKRLFIGLLNRGDRNQARLLLQLVGRPRRVRKLLVQRLPIADAAPHELGPRWDGDMLLQRLRE